MWMDVNDVSNYGLVMVNGGGGVGGAGWVGGGDGGRGVGGAGGWAQHGPSHRCRVDLSFSFLKVEQDR